MSYAALSEEVTAVRAEFASWSTRRKQAVDDAAAAAARRIEEDQENLQHQKDELEATEVQEEDVQRRSAETQREVEELQREVLAMQAQGRTLPREAQAAQAQAARAAHANNERARALEEESTQLDATLADLTERGCALYERYLGLTFVRMGGERLRLVFTNVDERDTSRAFSFEVFVDGADRYHGARRRPPARPRPARAAIRARAHLPAKSAIDFETAARVYKKPADGATSRRTVPIRPERSVHQLPLGALNDW